MTSAWSLVILSEVESKDPAELPDGSTAGFLDFARND